MCFSNPRALDTKNLIKREDFLLILQTIHNINGGMLYPLIHAVIPTIESTTSITTTLLRTHFRE